VNFLTDSLESADLANHWFVVDHEVELRIMAEGDGTLDPLDRTTWQGEDFDLLEEDIWNWIAPSASHQQLAENLVQTANFLAQSGVGEARRSGRSKNHCLFARDFNTWLSDRDRKKREKKTGQKCRPRRVAGKQRLREFIKWTDCQMKTFAEAKEYLGNDRMKQLDKDIWSNTTKTSGIERAEKNKQFDKGLKKKLKKVAAGNLNDVQALMDGSVILHHLNKGNGGREYLVAELDYRDVKAWKKKSQSAKDAMDEKALRHMLRSIERTRLYEEDGKTYDKDEQVTRIKPLSDKMKDWLKIQWQIINAKQGIVQDEEAQQDYNKT
jgi:putative component of toxin-antitoxin plasmid stabilization module